MNIIYRFLRARVFGIDDRSELEKAKHHGSRIGKNSQVMPGCILDPSHCWLISIGNNVTLAPRVHILAHDTSTKRELGYTKIGRVEIGSNVFVGANSTILPGTRIGDNVIIGANSLVTGSIDANQVVCGNPARRLCSYKDYMAKQKRLLENRPRYDRRYTINGGIDEMKKQQMITELSDVIGFVE